MGVCSDLELKMVKVDGRVCMNGDDADCVCNANSTHNSANAKSATESSQEVINQTLEELIFLLLLIVSFGVACCIFQHKRCPQSLIHPLFKYIDFYEHQV